MHYTAAVLAMGGYYSCSWKVINAPWAYDINSFRYKITRLEWVCFVPTWNLIEDVKRTRSLNITRDDYYTLDGFRLSYGFTKVIITETDAYKIELTIPHKDDYKRATTKEFRTQTAIGKTPPWLEFELDWKTGEVAKIYPKNDD